VRRLSTAVRDWYNGKGRIVKAWIIGLITVGLAATVVGSTSVLAEATQRPASSSPSQGAPSPPGASSPMAGMSPGTSAGAGSTVPQAGSPGGAAGMPGMTGGPGVGATASRVCPNVAGVTVMPNGMVMAPVPSGAPTAAEQAAADDLVAQVTADIQKYADLATAEAGGYRPASAGPPRGPYTHYIDPGIVESHDVLDPAHPPVLMYANTTTGPVLVGAMFLGPAPCQPGPDIGGPLTDWHAHNDLCLSRGVIVGTTRATGSCTLGVHSTETYFMLHVWTAPSIASQYQFQADVPASAFTSIIRTGQP
jgi:hypothetical protein